MIFLRRILPVFAAALVCLTIAAAAPARAQGVETGVDFGPHPPLLSVYGRHSPTLEGDHDFRQVIFFSVPASRTDRLYLRVFDPDAGGAHDTIFGDSWPIEGDTRTRFAVFGGDGAFVANVSVTGSPLATELSAGRVLADETFDLDETSDGQWRTIALLDPSEGDLVDGRRVFRLLVEGRTGNDGNLFSVAVSSEVGRNEAVDGTRIFSFVPTVRVPDEDRIVELSFAIPEDATTLRVSNFDVSHGSIVFTSKFRSVELSASGQNEWKTDEFALLEEEAGTVAALLVSGGREIPNDLTFHVSTSSGALLPVNLPPKLLTANRRPALSYAVTPLSCEGVAFDASASSDPDGEELSYLWHFGDGATMRGARVEHDYAAPGKYAARVVVSDSSGHVGDSTAENFTVTVKKKPVSVPRAKAMVARDVPVLFDGTLSTAHGMPMRRYLWTFEDGTVIEGARIRHRFATPGPKTARLRVQDISGHPCSTAEATVLLHVNARPVADAGEGGRAAIGETLAFDAGASADADGRIVSYRWDMGDGTVVEGRRIEHAYAKSGAYTVTLTVIDDAGVENSADTDTIEIVVNEPPRPDAGEDRVAAIGQTLGFDARASADDDGDIFTYEWDMGDGTRLSGLSVQHAYAEPGIYTVVLTVTDDAGVGNSIRADTATVTVNAPPLAEAGDEHRVAVGEPVVLDAGASRDTDGAFSRYRWDMGDGTVLEGRRVEHAYEAPGDYAVRLEVVDAAGVANSSDTDSARVLVNAPPVADAGDDVAAVIGEVIRFDAARSHDPDGNIVSYEWDFGDGGKATGPRPAHAYHALGEYRVTLTIKDGSRTSTDTARAGLTVRITDAPNRPPVAEAGRDLRVIVGEEIRFDGTASHDPDGSIIAHEWDFGDGFRQEGDTPLYAYREAGAYTVTLLVRDNSGLANATHTDTLTVTVDEPPNSAPVPAAGEDLSAAIDEPVTFDAARSHDPDGNILAYRWDFADGNKAEGVRVVHQFARSGTYEVVLSLQDDAKANTGFAQDTVVIKVNEPPVADAGPDQLVTASLVRFDGTKSSDSDGIVATWTWDFGDGGKDTGPTPTHVYREPGTYQVRLVVADDSGTIRNTANDEMQVVVNATPIADAGPDLIGEPGEKLVFQGDRSVDPDGAIESWTWDFKDGHTATGRIVEHAFEKPGTYYVGLRVQDDTGHGNAIDYAETVVVINAEPTADAGPDLRAAPGDEVTLDGTNSFDPDGQLTDYRWDFSDSDEPMSGEKITRTFDRPGVYKAQLTVVDDSDVNNGIAEDEVTIAINHAPVAEAGRNVVQPGLRVVFDGSESADADGDGLIYRWDFGDGQTATGARVAHTYVKGGVYPVILTVDDGTGLKNATHQDAMTVKINRPPVADAGQSRQVCTNDVVVFDGSKSRDPEAGVLRYAWDFGDGTRSDIVNPTKTFPNPGSYPVTLRVEDDSGLANATHSDRIMVKVYQAPAADAGPDRLACVNNEVKFDGTKSIDVDGVVNRYTWDFGDGGMGGGDRPGHIYRLPGKYRVLLNIEGDQGGRCDNTSSDEAWIRVIEAPIARIDALRAAPVAVPVAFDGQASTFADGRISKWHWDFGDGATAQGALVEHAFAEAGTYRVALTITSDAEIPDCRSITSYHVIEVNAPPVPAPGSDLEVSVNQDALFDGSASLDPDGGIVAYTWDFGDGTTGRGMQVHHRFARAGRYKVTLTVTDNTELANNTASADVWVTVRNPPGPRIEGPVAACVGEDVDWKAGKEEILDNTRFTWLLGDGATADQASLVHSYKKPGRYNVTLFVDDGSVISQSRRHSTRVLHVNQPPSAQAGPDKLVCPAVPVAFDATGSGDIDGKITSWHWDFGDGETAQGPTPEHVFAHPGTYQVRLTVTDDSGSSCAATTDTVQVVVNAPPVAEAGPDMEVFVGGANDVIVFDGSKSRDDDGQALSYFWQLGAATALSGERVRHMFTSAGEVPVTLTVADPTGLPCGTATDTMRVLVRGRE